MKQLSRGELLGLALAFLALGITVLVPIWPLAAATQVSVGALSLILTVACVIAAVRVKASPKASDDRARVILEGHFSHDPSEPREQGLALRVLGAPVREVQLSPFGMKGAEAKFDRIAALEPGQPPVRLIPRFTGRAKSIWDVVTTYEIAKIQPLRVATTVKGHQVVTSMPAQAPSICEIPLRITYRDVDDRVQTNVEYALRFIDSPDGAPIRTRLAVEHARRARPNAS